MYSVFRVFLIFTLGVKDEAFENVVVACDHTRRNRISILMKQRRTNYVPNFELGALPILSSSSGSRNLIGGQELLTPIRL